MCITEKGPFCVLRTKAYFMKNEPLLIQNNRVSVCPSNNSIIAPDKQYFSTLVFLCKLTSIFTTHHMGKVSFSMTEGSEGHRESSPGIKRPNIAEVISGTCAHFSVIKFVGHYRIRVKFRAFRKATMGGLAWFWSCATTGQKKTCIFKA